MLNYNTITTSILTNKTQLPIKHSSNNNLYKIYINPISITIDTFKNAFYPCNYFTPNEFVDITQFNYYTVRNTICTKLTDCSTNYVDCSASYVDCSVNYVDCSASFLDCSVNYADCSASFLDCSVNYLDCSASYLDCSGTMHRKFKNEPLCLYTQTLAKFMEYNGILCESTIDPRYMISFTNEIFKYTNFTTIPKVVSTMSWTNILNWIYIQLNKQCNICLRIELHYYDEQFMPYPVIYVFQYNIY